MKKILLAFLLTCAAATADAAFIGRLNTSLELEPVLARDFSDGFWMAGDQYRAWGLLDTARQGSPTVFFIAPQYLHGINGGNQSLGLSLGVPVGSAALAGIQGILGALSPALPLTIPPWLQNLSNYTTFQAGGGYNFLPQFQYIKPWFATFSLAVKVPIGAGSTL